MNIEQVNVHLYMYLYTCMRTSAYVYYGVRGGQGIEL